MTGVGASLYQGFCIVYLGKIYFGSTAPHSTQDYRGICGCHCLHFALKSSQIALITDIFSSLDVILEEIFLWLFKTA